MSYVVKVIYLVKVIPRFLNALVYRLAFLKGIMHATNVVTICEAEQFDSESREVVAVNMLLRELKFSSVFKYFVK